MNIRRILLIAIPAAFILAAVSAYFIFKGQIYTIYLEKQTIQGFINERIPHSKDFLLVLRLTVTDGDIHLQEGSDRVGVTASFELNIRISGEPKNFGGTITAYSGIRYDQASFSLYLIDPVIENIQLQYIPDKYTKSVVKHSRLILQHVATKHPVFQIKDDTLKTKLARAVLIDARVTNGKLVVKLGYR